MTATPSPLFAPLPFLPVCPGSWREATPPVTVAVTEAVTATKRGRFVVKLSRQLTPPSTFPLLTEGKVSVRSTPPRLDTVGLAFRVRSGSDTVGASIWTDKAGTDDEIRLFRASLPGGGFMAWGRGEMCVVEASVGKRAYGHNRNALQVDEALGVIREAVREACVRVEPFGDGTRFELSKVTRLDPVRDFEGVNDPTELLTGLSGCSRPGTQKTQLFQDPSRNRAQTLVAGPKAWHGTLYDKHQESDGEAPEGQLRYEARMFQDQLTSVWATKGGFRMGHVADMSIDKVDRLSRASFKRVCFDREVVGIASVASAIYQSDLTDRRKRELWAFLTMPGATATFHRETVYVLRKLAAELGVTPSMASSELPDLRVRLDYDAGTEVRRVA